MRNSPLVAPVNRPPFAGVRSERAPGQAGRIARRIARGGGVVGVGGNCAGPVTVGVSLRDFSTTKPQIFFSPSRTPHIGCAVGLSPADGEVTMRSDYVNVIQGQPAPTSEGQIENVGYRLADLTARLEAILNNGETVIDRRYGAQVTAADSGFSSAPCLPGSVGALQAAVDRLDLVIDRASAVVGRLGEA